MAIMDDTHVENPPQAENLGNALSMAAEIFASAQGGVSSSQPEQPEAAPPQSNKTDTSLSKDEIAAMLANMLATKTTNTQESSQGEAQSWNTQTSSSAPQNEKTAQGPGTGLGNIAAVLPSIMQAFSGNENFIKPEKLNLIKALKPYMTEARGSSIDRAIRMANIAQAAKTALTALGR